jgi:hypothetical protein
MKLKLQARDLWDVIEYGDGDYRDDRSALDAICSGVPAEMVPALAVKETAAEAWEAIKTLRVGDERRRAMSAQTLRTEYENIRLRDGEAIEDFALRFAGVIQRLGDLGDPEPEEKAVRKYLRVVRPRYKHLVVSMEAFVDLSTLTIEEITGTLKSSDAAYEELQPPSKQVAEKSEKLLLTHEEWLEKYKPHSQEGGRGGSNSGGRGKSRGGRGKPRGRGGHGNSGGSSSSNRASPGDTCKRCGKKGHWAHECRGKLKTQEQAHVAQEEEEQALLLSVCVDPAGDIDPQIEPSLEFVPATARRSPPTAPSTSSRTRSSLLSTTPATGIQSDGCWTPGPQTI